MKPWEANIRKVVPYVPGDQPRGSHLVKLNTNENPYPPAPGVSAALKEMDYDLFRKYPDPASSVLVDALSEYYKVDRDEIFVGVGSDDVIAMAFMTFFNSDKPVLSRTSPIPSIRFGRSFSACPMRNRLWMRISRL